MVTWERDARRAEERPSWRYICYHHQANNIITGPYIISVPNTRIRWRASLSRHCTGQRVYMVVQRSLHTHTNTHAHTGRLCVTASYIPSGSSQPPTYTTLRLQTYTLSKLYSCTTTGHGIPLKAKRENIFLSCAVFLEIWLVFFSIFLLFFVLVNKFGF